MDLSAIFSVENQALALQGLVALSALVAVAKEIAARTATKTDDRVVGAIADSLDALLSFIPLIRLGK